MKTVSIREAQDKFEELAQSVEQGETVTVTRDGKPVLDLVPRIEALTVLQGKPGGYDPEAGEAYLRSKGIVRAKGFVSTDFDDPLPEDFLLRPFP
ncbi:type II toxin-antitoxin system Phd/YefM family antitoxin [Neorhizobium sp. AL 9.2.2]|uniref:type II toxin-antitoxin system Phd/YefM family antitoxin n=1 Tax=Neorhizobium sp. AL 9.2.2 TaxID=2712894 RepID=UPI000DE0A274|nr:type II toxin-antitoxin system prevent-host-death family antitoxin [Neorhizobium sp. AL 9.2.2]NSY17679.1 type II toxin-antitoxin system prevent-host-death family antitoxin [Neorhizobium sp. AL 9.2.2]